jgi:hypothetical protein
MHGFSADIVQVCLIHRYSADIVQVCLMHGFSADFVTCTIFGDREVFNVRLPPVLPLQKPFGNCHLSAVCELYLNIWHVCVIIRSRSQGTCIMHRYSEGTCIMH